MSNGETINSPKNNVILLLRLYDTLPIELLEKYKLPDVISRSDLLKEVFDLLPDLTEKMQKIIEDLVGHWSGSDFITNDAVIEYFKSHYFINDFKKNELIHTYLVSKTESISYFLTEFSLLDVHHIENYLTVLTQEYEAGYTDYECRYACKCGMNYKMIINGMDVRDNIACCVKCGRSTKTWILLSGKVATLKRTIKRKFLPNKVETYTCGFEKTNYPQYDPDAEKYKEYFSPTRKPTFLKE